MPWCAVIRTPDSTHRGNQISSRLNRRRGGGAVTEDARAVEVLIDDIGRSTRRTNNAGCDASGAVGASACTTRSGRQCVAHASAFESRSPGASPQWGIASMSFAALIVNGIERSVIGHACAAATAWETTRTSASSAAIQRRRYFRFELPRGTELQPCEASGRPRVTSTRARVRGAVAPRSPRY